jgi:hypothetical protein
MKILTIFILFKYNILYIFTILLCILDTYDCVVIAGGMGEGHIPCVALHEMIRITKPG